MKVLPDENRYHPNGPWTAAEHAYFTARGEESWACSISQGPKIVATVTGYSETDAKLRAKELCCVVNTYFRNTLA